MKSINVIIFSSDFYPSQLVASRRITYWAKHLKEHLATVAQIKVITCKQNAQKVDGIDDLKILNKIDFPVLSKFWNLLQLILALQSEKSQSIIILSAGPFYFLLVSLFISKRHKLIFDLRDPFFGDTNHSTSYLKKRIKFIYQNWFIRRPKAVITINEYLRRDYNIPQEIPCLIVPNGFENNIFLTNHNKNKKIIVLGKVYGELNEVIDRMLELNKEIEFHQFINIETTHWTNRLPKRDRTYTHKEISKDKISEVCSKFEIGLVCSYPEDFVLPVKTFDYLSAGLKLLIVNDKRSEETELKTLLKNYPSVLYCYDDDIDERRFTEFLQNDSMTTSGSEIYDPLYFRNNSTHLLGTYLNKLNSQYL